MTTALGSGLRRAAARLAPDPAPDGDPEKVLQNLANQTGLLFKLEKQKVKALMVAK